MGATVCQRDNEVYFLRRRDPALAPAAYLAERIHNRMPVILPAEAVADWLNIRYDAMDVLRAAMLNMEYRPA